MSIYVPELGQAVFGARWSEHECPDYVVALLSNLSEEIGVLLFNRDNDNGFVGPGDNSGIRFEELAETFVMRCYSWADCECPEDGDVPSPDCASCQPNFKSGDFEVRWYKHLRRGTTCNRVPEPGEMVEIYDRCMDSVRGLEKAERGR